MSVPLHAPPCVHAMHVDIHYNIIFDWTLVENRAFFFFFFFGFYTGVVQLS